MFILRSVFDTKVPNLLRGMLVPSEESQFYDVFLTISGKALAPIDGALRNIFCQPSKTGHFLACPRTKRLLKRPRAGFLPFGVSKSSRKSSEIPETRGFLEVLHQTVYKKT